MFVFEYDEDGGIIFNKNYSDNIKENIYLKTSIYL